MNYYMQEKNKKPNKKLDYKNKLNWKETNSKELSKLSKLKEISNLN